MNQQESPIRDYYRNVKIYNDGSHYIGIPHTERPKHYRSKKNSPSFTGITTVNSDITRLPMKEVENKPVNPVIPQPTANIKQSTVNLKDSFDELYIKYFSFPNKKRKIAIAQEMEQYFDTAEELFCFLDINFKRKERNAIERNKRMVRKARLADFNYFVTFTFDGNKHSPESFRKTLSHTLSNLSTRKGWTYMGVWEQSAKDRLHFHGLFHIPDNAMVGILFEKKDYSIKSKRIQTTIQNTYFNERFGRSDFEPICSLLLGKTLGYMMKYIEKSGERIVYSKGLYEYFVCDIMGTDIAAPYGVDDRKILLFDGFDCWDDGELMGRVSKETIAKLPRSN